MKTIEEMIAENVSNGMTINQAENYACQEIVLNKIAKSRLADKVLIKGGVVMFHMTKNLRRVTSDLDFDFIRYDISEESIKLFINLLNNNYSEYVVNIIKIEPLHQDDYQGKRVWTLIKDKTRSVKFKLDIGVHTLLGVEQDNLCFSFTDEKPVLCVNPPEQIFAEKLYSLAKHGPLSTRFKDVFDIYYLIKHGNLNFSLIKKCLDMLTIRNNNGISSLEDICDIISSTFEDKQYIENIKTTKEKWLDVNYQTMFTIILDYIYSI